MMKAPIAHVGSNKTDARRTLGASGASHALLVDDEERPIGWIRVQELDGDGTLDASLATPGASLIEPETTLRDALSAMLASSVQLGVVVDERERVMGLISVDQISGVLQQHNASAAPAASPAAS
jgi:CBS domain containing-hemolysin-like protein